MIRELEIEEIRKVYNEWMVEDFPKAELKPLSIIEKTRESGQYVCYGYFDEDELKAYAFWVKADFQGKKICLFDYFAVRKGKRGSGIGSTCLKELSEFADEIDVIIVEVEDPAKAQNQQQKTIRDRRYSFYMNNGLKDSECLGRAWGVDYKILLMATDGKLDKSFLKKSYYALYKTMLPMWLLLTQIRFWIR